MTSYEIFKVKDKTDINHKEMPIWDLPFRLLINGKSQLSGKTTLLLNLLMNPQFKYDNTFDGEDIYLISDNKLDNKLKILMDYKDIPAENLMPYDEKDLENLYEELEEKFQEEMSQDGKAKNRLLIFDDVGYSGNLKNKNYGIITKLIANGRHLNLSQIYTSQRFTMVSTSLRSNLTGAILFNTSAKELDLIAEDFNYLENKRDFIKMFRRETAKPRNFLVINFTNPNSIYMNTKFQTIEK
jgi:hypothetical protein